MTKYVEEKLKAHGFKSTGIKRRRIYSKTISKYLIYEYDEFWEEFTINFKVRNELFSTTIKKFPTLRKFLQSLENAKFVI